MGDFNFVEAPTIDCRPAKYKQNSPEAVFELARLRSHLGGMVDAYRVINGFEDKVTYHGRPGCGDTKSRHDRIYIPIKHAQSNTTPCLRTMKHICSAELTVTVDGNTPITSDHDAVMITYRLGDIRKPEKKWAYSRPEDPEEIEEVRKAVVEATDKQPATPEIMLHAINKAAKDVRTNQIKKRKAKRYKASRTLLNKIASVKNKIPASQEQRRALKAQIVRWLRQYTAMITKFKNQGNIRASGDWLNKDRGDKAHFKPLRPILDNATMTMLKSTTTDDKGNMTHQELTSQEDIAQYQKQQWSALFNLGDDRLKDNDIVSRALNNIRRDNKTRVNKEEGKTLTIDNILDPTNVKAAINRMHESAGGQDGLTLTFWKDTIDIIVEPLSDILKEILKRGYMTKKMREAIVTLIYKKKGETWNWKNYRPIAVTEMAYRILGKCIQLKLGPVLQKVIGPSQAGFVSQRLIEEDVLAITELSHFADKPGRSGLLIFL